jgi:hypothetical protein
VRVEVEVSAEEARRWEYFLRERFDSKQQLPKLLKRAIRVMVGEAAGEYLKKYGIDVASNEGADEVKP